MRKYYRTIIISDNQIRKLYNKFNINDFLEMDNNEILRENKGKKFNIILSNPPYDRNLHLKFLEKYIQLADKVISIQPCGWITDTYANDKKSNFQKYEDSILKHIKDIEIYDWQDSSILFGIISHQSIGIYICDKNGGFDYKKIPYIGKCEKIIKITKEFESLEDHIEYNKFDGIRVRTQAVKNYSPSSTSGGFKKRYEEDLRIKYSLMYKSHSVISKDGFDLEYSDKWWSEIGMKNKYTKKKGEPIPHSIKFDTIEEAKNFENYCKTDFFTYCMYLSKVGVNTDFKHLPWLGNVKWKGKSGEINGYKNEITDEMLYEYFNLSKEDIDLIKNTLDGKK